MLKGYESVSYELLRPEEIKILRENCPIAYIPAGALEWHSFHLPMGTDGIKAHAVCCEAALKFGGVVLPPLYLGLMQDTKWGPPGWEGYSLGLRQVEVFQAVALGMVKGLTTAGWKVIVGVTGHDVAIQRDALQLAIAVGTSVGIWPARARLSKPVRLARSAGIRFQPRASRRALARPSSEDRYHGSRITDAWGHAWKRCCEGSWARSPL